MFVNKIKYKIIRETHFVYLLFIVELKLNVCIKKGKTSKSVYEVYLKAALNWGKSWYIILESANKTYNQDPERKYKILDEKLNRLVKS
jgi:hypothetical protein